MYLISVVTVIVVSGLLLLMGRSYFICSCIF